MAVTIVGPDGVGKSTLRLALTGAISAHHDAITDRSVGPMRRTHAGSGTVDGSGHPCRLSKTASAIKLAYLWLDEWIRWVVRVRPMSRSGGWVISERGWWDVAVVPGRYRMHALPVLHRMLSRFVPLPDLLVVLEARPDIVVQRKNELSLAEIERQRVGWHSITAAGQPMVFLAAEQSSAEVLAETLHAIADALGEGDRARGCPIAHTPLGFGRRPS